MGKRPREEPAFVFDPTNCIGDDAVAVEEYVPEAPVARVDAVADFCEAMEIQSSFAPILPPAASASEYTIEDIDGEPVVENLGVTYSPADDERCNSATTERLGCRTTPDPMSLVDPDTAALIGMLEGGDDGGSLLCMEPLTAQAAEPPMPPPMPPMLNQSGQHGCFATHLVHDPPPRLGLRTPRGATPTPAEYAAMPVVPEPKEAKAVPLHLFHTVEGNHSGVFSEFGGVRAWMSNPKKTLVN